MFDCKVYILYTKDYLEKFSIKTNKEILIIYSLSSRAFRVYNKMNLKVKEYSNIVFDENPKKFIDKNIDGDLNKEIIFGIKKLTLDDNVQWGVIRGSDNERGEVENVVNVDDTSQLPRAFRFNPIHGVRTSSSFRN